MGSKRRVGGEGSETRGRIVQAAEQVIRDEGYGAASTRRVAQHAGLRPSLVHYYFPTTDDLFLAVFRHGAEQSDRMIDAALASDDPIRGLWLFFSDESRTALSVEFIALAIHRAPIRAEIVRHSEAMRARQAATIDHALGARFAALGDDVPVGLSLVLAGIGRALVTEAALGVHGGHAEARALVDHWLGRLFPAADAKAFGLTPAA